MKEYDVKDVNYDVLKFLRKNTIIGPIAVLKIDAALKQAAIVQKYYKDIEHANLGIDTSVADALEYSYRMNAFQNKLFKDWLNYGNGKDLEEYTYDVINYNINKNAEKTI